MSRTVDDIITKLAEIDDGIWLVRNRMDDYGREFPGQEPLMKVVDLLEEYKLMLLNGKVDV